MKNTLKALALVLIIGLAATYIQSQNRKSSEQYSKTKTPTIIYAETYEADNGEIKLDLYKKTNQNQSEFLATFDNQSPEYYYHKIAKISPDNNLVAINNTKKIEAFNLKTKTQEIIHIAEKSFGDIVFSPDSKKIFVWDQEYYEDYNYQALIINLETKAVQIIKQGSREFPLNGYLWRDDNKIILLEPHGPISIPVYFDLEKNEIFETAQKYDSWQISENGQIIAAGSEYVDNVCSDLFPLTTKINIANFISGEFLGSIGDKSLAITPIEFSPDNKQILYSLQTPRTSKDQCPQPEITQYYITDIKTGSSEKIENHQSILKSWRKNYIGASIEYIDDVLQILTDNEPILTPKEDRKLHLIGQFLQ